MRKLLLIAIVLLGGFYVLHAQQLQIMEADSRISAVSGGEIKASLRLVNRSKNKVQVYVKKVNENSLLTNQTRLCLYGDCQVIPSSSFVLLGSMEAGEVWEDFYLLGTVGLRSGEGLETYLFSDSNQSEKTISWELRQLVQEPLSKNDLISTPEIIASQMYPNPADNVVNITYEIKDPRAKVEITMYNMLGSQVASYRLEESQSHLKIQISQLQPGIYFYSLRINGTNQATKKLIIKR